MNVPRVAIIILNWNGYLDTLECLDSLAQIDYPAVELILIDNGSTNESVPRIKEKYPRIDIHETGENLGYAVGNNIGLELAVKKDCKYSLLLNNDTVVSKTFLDDLVNTLETHPNVGMVGPKIHYHDLPDKIWSAGGEINWMTGDTHMSHVGEDDLGQVGDLPLTVDFLTGCAVMVRTSIFQKIGGLDPRFFCYYEDAEWCVRAHRAGCEIKIVPNSKIWHKISPVAREESPAVQYYMARNRLLFIKTIKAGWIPLLITMAGYFKLVLGWIIKPKWKRKRKRMMITVRGIVDYFFRRFGKVDADRIAIKE